MSTQTNTLSAARRAESQERKEKRSRLRLAGEIAGVVSTLVGVVGLLFVLAPSLKPAPPPLRKEAFFRGIDVERNVTRAQYLQRIDRGVLSLATSRLRKGSYRFEVVLTDGAGRVQRLTWPVRL